MATPIRWDNVQAPNNSSAFRDLREAGRDVASAFSGLGDLAKKYEQDEKDRMTGAYLAALQQTEKEDEVKAIMGAMSGNIDATKVTSLGLRRKDEIFKRGLDIAREGRAVDEHGWKSTEFSDSQQDRKDKILAQTISADLQESAFKGGYSMTSLSDITKLVKERSGGNTRAEAMAIADLVKTYMPAYTNAQSNIWNIASQDDAQKHAVSMQEDAQAHSAGETRAGWARDDAKAAEKLAAAAWENLPAKVAEQGGWLPEDVGLLIKDVSDRYGGVATEHWRKRGASYGASNSAHYSGYAGDGARFPSAKAGEDAAAELRAMGLKASYVDTPAELKAHNATGPHLHFEVPQNMRGKGRIAGVAAKVEERMLGTATKTARAQIITPQYFEGFNPNSPKESFTKIFGKEQGEEIYRQHYMPVYSALKAYNPGATPAVAFAAIAEIASRDPKGFNGSIFGVQPGGDGVARSSVIEQGKLWLDAGNIEKLHKNGIKEALKGTKSSVTQDPKVKRQAQVAAARQKAAIKAYNDRVKGES